MAQTFKYRLLGLVFIGLLLLGAWYSYASLTNQFAKYDKVTLRTDAAGLQLPNLADVKIRGQIVGQVTQAKSTGDGKAVLELGMFPETINIIPKNVTAALLPKTLFGEKFVNLVVPAQPVGELQAGDVITKAVLPIEVEEVLADIYPLLRTVQPAELNYTLNAIATAMEGQGKNIAANIKLLNRYLDKFSPKIPAIIKDLKLLSKVAGVYTQVMPDIARTLRNSVKTGKTLVAKERKLNVFLRDAATFSGVAKDFLDTNGDNIVRVGKLTAPVAALLRRYSPEFPCLLGGLAGGAERQADTFRGFIFHINARIILPGPRGYGKQDAPVYGANNDPYCGTLPNPPWNPNNPYRNPPDLNDGVAGQLSRAATSFKKSVPPVTGTPQEKAVLLPLMQPALGVPVAEIDDTAALLFGPLVRGTEVSYK